MWKVINLIVNKEPQPRDERRKKRRKDERNGRNHFSQKLVTRLRPSDTVQEDRKTLCRHDEIKKKKKLVLDDYDVTH